jgi:ectoine hydroxylase-related dioxygenase (phytanoyl-CoA dioxygenase family)
MSSHGIREDERRAWHEDGFFVRRAAFTAAEVEALRDAAESTVARVAAAAGRGGNCYAIDGNRYEEALDATLQYEHQPGSQTLRVIEPFHHFDARFEALIDDPRLVDPMRDLVGDDRVSLFTDKLNLKRPRDGSRFRWHQDSPYWAHFTRDLDRLPNVMVALDDAGEHNGCFRVIRGSHRKGLLPGLEGEGTLGPLFTDPRYFDLSEQVPAVVPSGSLVFFSPHTVHGSEPNRSDDLRRAMVLTYQPGGRRMFKVDAKREAGLRAQPEGGV